MPILAYHFTMGNLLRNGKPLPPIGKWLRHYGEVIPCYRGLHASEHPFDALKYAPGTMLHLVRLGGKLRYHGSPVDKLIGSRRQILKSVDATQTCRSYACWCALKVAHMWDMPDLIKDYLTTQDAKLAHDAYLTEMQAPGLGMAALCACTAGFAAVRAAQAGSPIGVIDYVHHASSNAYYAFRYSDNSSPDLIRDEFKKRVDVLFQQ